MNCPVDDSQLVMTERQGIEIDYCPKCRGVWLDRGELDKIIERTAVAPGPGNRDDRDDRDDDRYRVREQDAYPSSDRRGYPHHKTKRRSLLDDLFDFD